MREERFIDSAIRKALGRQTPEPAPCCPDENLLAAYLERSLSDQERSRLESHLAQCASCQELLALAMKTSGEVGLPAAGIGVSRERKLLFRFSIPLAATAALALGIGMGTLFLLTREFRKPGRTEVAQQMPPAAVPGPGGMQRARSEPPTVPLESGKPSTPSLPPGQAASIRVSADQIPPAKDKEAGLQEQPSSAEFLRLPESEGKLPKADSIASNEAANKPKQWKGESDAGTATMQAAGGTTAGGAVGGVVGGILPPPRPAEEQAVTEVAPQAAVVTTDSSTARIQAADRETRTAKSRRASLSMALSPSVESRLRDAIRGVAADEKEGKRSDSGTRAIGGRIFARRGGFWVDLKCIGDPDADLIDCKEGSAGLDQILKAVPGLDELRREGLPILLDWNGRICLIR